MPEARSAGPAPRGRAARRRRRGRAAGRPSARPAARRARCARCRARRWSGRPARGSRAARGPRPAARRASAAGAGPAQRLGGRGGLAGRVGDGQRSWCPARPTAPSRRARRSDSSANASANGPAACWRARGRCASRSATSDRLHAGHRRARRPRPRGSRRRRPPSAAARAAARASRWPGVGVSSGPSSTQAARQQRRGAARSPCAGLSPIGVADSALSTPTTRLPTVQRDAHLGLDRVRRAQYSARLRDVGGVTYLAGAERAADEAGFRRDAVEDRQ